jgi:hypothetical protein
MNLKEQIEVAQSQSFSKMQGVYTCPELTMPAVDQALMTTKSTQAAGTTS